MNTENLRKELIRFCGEEPIKETFVNISKDVNLRDDFVLRLLHYKVAELVAPSEIEGFRDRGFAWYFRVEHRDSKKYPVLFLGKLSNNPAAGWEVARREQLDQLLKLELTEEGKYDITLA
jgi:hypothetical protein